MVGIGIASQILSIYEGGKPKNRQVLRRNGLRASAPYEKEQETNNTKKGMFGFHL